MENLIRIGIKEPDNNKLEKLKNLFYHNIKEKIKIKKQVELKLDFQDYNKLKEFFKGEPLLKRLEKNEIPAITNHKEIIILFGELFFNRVNINQLSIFIHEIGHICTSQINRINVKHPGLLAYYLYNEFLADKFLFEIDEKIFKEGRVKEDLNLIKDLNKKITLYLILGRLYYYKKLGVEDRDLNDKIYSIENKISIYYDSNSLRRLKELISEFDLNYDKMENKLENFQNIIDNLNDY